MCIGYDPFRWADVYSSEEEYMEDLENELRNDTRERQASNDGNAECRAGG